MPKVRKASKARLGRKESLVKLAVPQGHKVRLERKARLVPLEPRGRLER